MKKRNLFSVGAMRAGSTSLYHYLSQHPDIFVPHRKEPGFFLAEEARNRLSIGGLSSEEQAQCHYVINKGRYHTEETYDSLYIESSSCSYRADCSHYLHTPATAKIIHEYNPEAMILISLRAPVERIYSEYMLYARVGKVSESFPTFINQMLKKDEDGNVVIKTNSRLNKGFYAELIKPWLSYFGENQVKIILFDDLKARPGEVCTDIYTWLGVDNAFKPNFVRAQRGGVPKSNKLMNAMKSTLLVPQRVKNKIPASLRWRIKDLIYSKALEREEMREDINILLKSLYRPYVCDLEALLNTNLTAWK